MCLVLAGTDILVALTCVADVTVFAVVSSTLPQRTFCFWKSGISLDGMKEGHPPAVASLTASFAYRRQYEKSVCVAGSIVTSREKITHFLRFVHSAPHTSYVVPTDHHKSCVPKSAALSVWPNHSICLPGQLPAFRPAVLPLTTLGVVAPPIVSESDADQQ